MQDRCDFNQTQEAVRDYYEEKLQRYGSTAAGVDWNSQESQTLRFEQLLKVCDEKAPFSLIDYGCGYGALATCMMEQGLSFQYQGFDISPRMVAKAKEIHRGNPSCRFFEEEAILTPAEFVVASGIFNVKLQAEEAQWKAYVLHTLERIHALSERGFAFNLLTSHSEPHRMRPDLYYADPCFFLDHCKTRFSKDVALLHDYGLYEFTLLVRKTKGL
jgi:SAM-dependent methyltransferase